jgi:hypothetical protein
MSKQGIYKVLFLSFSKTQKPQDGIPDYLSYGMSSSVHPLSDFCFGSTVTTFHQFTFGCVKKCLGKASIKF